MEKNRLNIKVNACKSKLKNPRHVCKVRDKIVFKILILDNLFQTQELEILLGTFSYLYSNKARIFFGTHIP